MRGEVAVARAVRSMALGGDLAAARYLLDRMELLPKPPKPNFEDLSVLTIEELRTLDFIAGKLAAEKDKC